jgi:hypothetical protein
MSIKRKFATAVATASLLAGLFGSALVSTASAARIGGSGDASASKSIIHDDTFGSDLAMTFNTDADELGKDAGPKDFFWSLDGNAATALDNNAYVVYDIRDKANDGVDRVGELKATASSSLIKLSWLLENDGEDEGTDGTCADAQADIASNTITSTDLVEGAEGDATVAADAPADGSLYKLCIYSNDKAGKATVTVTADGVSLPSFTVTTFGTLASLTLSVRNGHNYVAEDNDGVSRYFSIVGKDSAGQTLNAGGGGAYYDDGDGVNYGTLDDFALAEGEDVGLMADDEVADFLGALTDNRGLGCSVALCGAAADAAGADRFEAGYTNTGYALASDLCGANDAGKAYSFSVEGTTNDGDNDTVTSNTVSITCTGNEAKVSAVTVEATTGAKKYNESGTQDDVLSIWATVLDQAGRPMGVGVTVDFDISFDGEADLNETIYVGDIDITGSVDDNSASLGNKVEIGYLEPDVDMKAEYPYTVTLAESDLGADDSVELVYEGKYTVDASAVEKTYTISSVRNAAKTRATITVNFGAACSRKLVDFDVQLANGDVKYLTRRANISGVATLIMERRNTKIYVQAFCGGSALTGYDLESDLRGVRFR